MAIPCIQHERWPFALEASQGREMRVGEVLDVNVIAHTGTVTRGQ